MAFFIYMLLMWSVLRRTGCIERRHLLLLGLMPFLVGVVLVVVDTCIALVQLFRGFLAFCAHFVGLAHLVGVFLCGWCDVCGGRARKADLVAPDFDNHDMDVSKQQQACLLLEVCGGTSAAESV